MRRSLRLFRGSRLAGAVEGDRLTNERLESGPVDCFSFVDVDRAAGVSVETRVEETSRILERRALGERELHDALVGLAGADDAVVRPDRGARRRGLDPLPLLDDVRVCFLDELAHSAEGLPAPVPELGDSFREEVRCRLALARARHFHVLVLEAAEVSGDPPGVSMPNCFAYSVLNRFQPSNFMASGPTMRPIGSPARDLSRTSKQMCQPAAPHEMKPRSILCPSVKRMPPASSSSCQ